MGNCPSSCIPNQMKALSALKPANHFSLVCHYNRILTALQCHIPHRMRLQQFQNGHNGRKYKQICTAGATSGLGAA
jgi:hypothetical protein